MEICVIPIYGICKLSAIIAAMNQFQLYFKLGIEYILDMRGFEHVLFVIVLCAIYFLKDWKKIIFLVTAFTIGNSITLALATLKLVKIDSGIVNFLIPLTIAITAFSNLIKPKPSNGRGIQVNYWFALVFGLIHGMGFSHYLRFRLGRQGAIIEPLLAFNLGIEVGQLAVVGLFLVFSSLAVGIFGINRKEWTLVVSATVLGMSLMMLLGSKFW